VARAKQTARSEARRRARVANRAVEVEDEGLEGSDESAAAPARPNTASGRTARPVAGGFMAALRSSYHRPDVRADLAALPPLLLGKSFLAALGLILVGAIASLVYPGYSGSVLLFQFLTYPPALAPIFLAGFFAPRASYLLGLIVGVFDAIVYSVLLVQVAPTLDLAPGSTLGGYIITSLLSSAATGIVFGAGAAWYRRFLQLTSPRRQASARNQPARGKQPANTRRR